jgi:hypothetical protein
MIARAWKALAKYYRAHLDCGVRSAFRICEVARVHGTSGDVNDILLCRYHGVRQWRKEFGRNQLAYQERERVAAEHEARLQEYQIRLTASEAGAAALRACVEAMGDPTRQLTSTEIYKLIADALGSDAGEALLRDREYWKMQGTAFMEEWDALTKLTRKTNASVLVAVREFIAERDDLRERLRLWPILSNQRDELQAEVKSLQSQMAEMQQLSKIDVSTFDTILCSVCGYPWRAWKNHPSMSMFPNASMPPKCCDNASPGYFGLADIKKLVRFKDALEEINASWSVYALSDGGDLAKIALDQIKKTVDQALGEG